MIQSSSRPHIPARTWYTGGSFSSDGLVIYSCAGNTQHLCVLLIYQDSYFINSLFCNMMLVVYWRITKHLSAHFHVIFDLEGFGIRIIGLHCPCFKHLIWVLLWNASIRPNLCYRPFLFTSVSDSRRLSWPVALWCFQITLQNIMWKNSSSNERLNGWRDWRISPRASVLRIYYSCSERMLDPLECPPLGQPVTWPSDSGWKYTITAVFCSL